MRAAAGGDWPPRVEVIFFGGQVLACDEAFARASALAVAGERIVAVGDDAAVRALAGPGTLEIDLRGRTLMPGLIDAHAHFEREGLRRVDPSLMEACSIADVQAVLRREVARARPGEWIVLGPLGEPPYFQDVVERLAERRYPDRHDLDAVAPANPVFIRQPWGYWSDQPPFVGIANSLALKLAGVGRDTRSPSASLTIERDADGEPTGRFLESALVTVLDLTLLRAAPRFTLDVRVRSLREAQQRHLAVGTVGIHEGHGIVPELWDAYKVLRDAGELWVRAYLPLAPVWAPAEAERTLTDWSHTASGPGFGDAWLQRGGVYISTPFRNEAVTPVQRAALPYTGWCGFFEPYLGWEEYREAAWLAARCDLRVHTIGSSVELDGILDTWEAIDREIPIREKRWVVGHARSLPAAARARLKRLGVVATVIPGTHLYRDGWKAIERDDDFDDLLPLDALSREGIPWALSTDNKPHALFWALWAALARVDQRSGRTLGTAGRPTREAALRAATHAGAYGCFAERERGTLASGKLADLIVLADDPLTCPLDSLRELPVELTMVGGRVVHTTGDDLPPADLSARER